MCQKAYDNEDDWFQMITQHSQATNAGATFWALSDSTMLSKRLF